MTRVDGENAGIELALIAWDQRTPMIMNHVAIDVTDLIC